METGGSSRGPRSFSEEKVDSPNLRDFLRVKEDNNDDGHSFSGLTLSAVLEIEKRSSPSPAQVNRTLLDVIRDDPNGGNKKSWKTFKDKIRLRRAGAAWTSSVPTPSSDVPIQSTNTNRIISRRNSTRFQPDQLNHPELPSSSSSSSISISVNGGENLAELNTMPSNRTMMMVRNNSSRVPTLSASGYGRSFEGSTFSNTGEIDANYAGESVLQAAEEEEEAEEVAEGGEAPVRMSLMSLLAETDREMGLDGPSNYMIDGEEEEEDEEEGESGAGGVGGEYNNCCVCMVRHKGSAFIPCGHTFCRLCSRELWVQRGNCPICNGFILEILDIF